MKKIYSSLISHTPIAIGMMGLYPIINFWCVLVLPYFMIVHAMGEYVGYNRKAKHIKEKKTNAVWWL